MGVWWCGMMFKTFNWSQHKTKITLDAKLDGQVQSIAQQMGTTVDEIVNNILEKYLGNNGEQWKDLLSSMPNVVNDDDFSRPLDYGREQSWDI